MGRAYQSERGDRGLKRQFRAKNVKCGILPVSGGPWAIHMTWGVPRKFLNRVAMIPLGGSADWER